jgi:hypothetical protein
MTKKIFYEKVGRRYVPVSEYDSEYLDSFREGVHLVISYPGGQSRRFNIDPAFGPMIAAGRFAEDAISRRIMDVSAMRSKTDRKPLTPEQVSAWEALQAAFGDEMYPLEYCSYREAAEEGVKAMQIEAEKMLENPAVKKAWDNFMLVWQLTKKEM